LQLVTAVKRTDAGWSNLLLWTAIVVAILQAIVGIAHVDREALAFAVLFAIGVVVLWRAKQRRRVYAATVVILGLLFADVAFWMITATWSNARNHEQLLYIVEPLALACASAAGLIAVAGQLIDRRGRAQTGPAIVTIGAVATFVVCLGAAAVAGWGKEQMQGPSDLVLKIHNTAYSSANINATSRQVTLYVTNDDLFWHTVTIDQLGVELPLPVGSHRRITFTAPSGIYTFYCRIPGHRQAGMVGTITLP
jgi:plastocyanin